MGRLMWKPIYGCSCTATHIYIYTHNTYIDMMANAHTASQSITSNNYCVSLWCAHCLWAAALLCSMVSTGILLLLLLLFLSQHFFVCSFVFSIMDCEKKPRRAPVPDVDNHDAATLPHPPSPICSWCRYIHSSLYQAINITDSKNKNTIA